MPVTRIKEIIRIIVGLKLELRIAKKLKEKCRFERIK